MILGSLIKDFYCSLRNDRHEILADIDDKLGGTDRGQNPHELLESALSACTIMTIQSYAKRKGYILDTLEVKVSIEKEGEENLITKEITFPDSLDEEVKSKLLQIASKCPIHKLLTSNVTIETTH